MAPLLANGYLGSEACQTCHEPEYGNWKRSLHVRMTKPIAEALVVGDFAPGTHLEQYGRAYDMEIKDGRYFVSVSHRGRPAEKFRVDYTLGARRFQGYLSTLPDGRIYVLPVFWNVQTKRWVDWKEITPVPDSDHDLRQIWNVTCFNCHATNLAKNFDLKSRTYASTWTEMGIGCEACHGPGREHVDLTEAWRRDPSTRPAYDSRASNPNLGKILRIFSPRSADRRQVYDSCAYCHGNKSNVFVGFKPGDRYEDFALPFLISQPIPDNDPQGDYWPDGRPNRFNRPQALTLSGCFMSGQVTCTNCHVGHGSKNDHALKVPIEQSNALCTQCHKTFRSSSSQLSAMSTPPSSGGSQSVDSSQASAISSQSFEFEGPDLTKHTHHAPGSLGSRCIECHMSNVNWRLLTRRRDHTFAAPVPEMTSSYGAPNACTTCHENRSPEWAAGVMDRWYGNRERRARVVTVADTMYRAGAGDAAALPGLAAVLVDRPQGALLRASAAEFIGRLIGSATGALPSGSPAESQTALTVGASSRPRQPVSSEAPVVPSATIVNALIAGAADPEAMVRITAVRSLGIIGDPRAVSPLAARLIDNARLVRTAAAEALLQMGIVSLDGPVGAALRRAQDEYAEGLRTFPDVSGDHTSLAWLLMSRGESAPAQEQLTAALDLDPADSRATVYRGVLAARQGQLSEAIRLWKSVRDSNPNYPNIDRLIQEAQRQLSTPKP